MFALLLIAQGFSLTGGYIQTLVLSWMATDTAGGLYALSFYMIACYLPVAVLAYPFGRWLDARSQKKWLLLSEGALAALSLLLYLAARADWISFPFLLISGGVWGIIRAFQTPIYQSLPKKLAKNLSQGTALLTTITCTARGLGPILGGYLYQAFGASIPILANSLSFLPSFALLCLIRIPRAHRSEKPSIKRHFPLLGKIFLVGFLGVHYNVTFVALVRDQGYESGAFGLALGLLGLGALFGFFLKNRTKNPLPLSRFPLLMGALHLCLTFTTDLFWLGACIFFYGILDFWFFAQCVYLLTKSLPQEQTTAVMGLYTAVSVGAMPAGALLWSFTAHTLGLSATLPIIAGGLLLLSASFFLQEKAQDL